MNTMNQILSHDSESIATAMQSLKKANNWLSSFIESYSPPLDGERLLTTNYRKPIIDGETRDDRYT